MIFMDLCSRADIPPKILPLAFPTMLRSTALEYYYSSCMGSGLTMHQLLDEFQAHFEGAAHRRNKLREWNSISLRTSIRANPDKHRGAVFNEMIRRLRQIQWSLEREYQSDSALRDKIIISCSDVPPCGVAVLLQTSTVSELTNKIHAAIEMDEAAMEAERSRPLDGSPTVLTDRKHHTRHLSSNRPPEDNDNPSNIEKKKKRCFLCKQEGCWSAKHSDKERQEARKRFIIATKKRCDAYIQEYEGKELSEHDKFFETLILELAEHHY